MLYLHVFCQTGLLQWVDFWVVPSIFCMKMEASRYVPCPRKQTSKLASLFSSLSLFVLSTKQGSCEYHFIKSFSMTQLEEMNPRSTDCKADALTTMTSCWSYYACIMPTISVLCLLCLYYACTLHVLCLLCLFITPRLKAQ